MRAILALLVFTSASTAYAGFYTGNDLYPMCETNGQLVFGYVAGVVDKQIYDVMVLNKLDNSPPGDPVAFARKYRVGADICYPEGMVLQQPRDIFCKYLADHPESRQKDAETLVQTAVSEAWPCK